MNELFINKKKWNTFNETEFQNYIERVYNYYRENGFPYFSTDKKYRGKEFNKLIRYDFTKCIDNIDGYNVIKQTMHGLALCWSYHPHSFNVECSNKRSVIDTFNNDDLLKRVIEKRVKFGDNMSDNGLRKMIKIFTGTQGVSNFRPTASASIYSHFSSKGDTVLDMSSGYGGRLLGSHISGRKYIGFEPSLDTWVGLNEMINDFGMDAVVLNHGSEIHYEVESNSVDLCFTSPPYFDTERYSNELTQSYLKYTNYRDWIDFFIGDTLINCRRVLKHGKPLLINIANTKGKPNMVNDVINVAKRKGFGLIDTWYLHLSKLGKGKGFKKEPILIFVNMKMKTRKRTII